MNDIESKLKDLLPNPGTLDRDQLLYSAGFAAGKASGRKPWRLTSVLLCVLLIGVCLGWFLTPRLTPLPANAVKQAEPIPQAKPERPEPYQPEPMSYIALMQRLGEDAKPTGGGTADEPQPPLTPRSPID